MNKTHIKLRQVFLRMNTAKKSVSEIAEFTGVNVRTIYNWKKLLTESDGEKRLLSQPSKTTYTTNLNLVLLESHFTDHPFEFHAETGRVFNRSRSTIQRWRSKLGFKRKKSKTVYREASDELKKTSR